MLHIFFIAQENPSRQTTQTFVGSRAWSLTGPVTHSRLYLFTKIASKNMNRFAPASSPLNAKGNC